MTQDDADQMPLGSAGLLGTGSNEEAEIAAALASIDRYSPRVSGGTPYPMGVVGRTSDEDMWARAMEAATALRAAQENRLLQQGAPRVTDALDRARYYGS